MRLIRLLSPSPIGRPISSEFECYFMDNIMIKPNSKIALLNASVPLNPNDVYIDNLTNTLTFRTAQGLPTRTATLPTQGYTIPSLLKALNNAVNDQLHVDVGSECGFLVDFVLQQIVSNSIRMNVWRGKNSYMDLSDGVNPGGGITMAGNNFTRAAGGDVNNTFLLARKPLLTSCGYFRTQIKTAIRNISIGVSSTYAELDTFADGRFSFMIGIRDVGGAKQYYYKDNTNAYINVDLAICSPVLGDWVELAITEGNVIGNIYRNNNPVTADPLFSYPRDVNDMYFPCIALRQQGATVTPPSLIYDPRAFTSEEGDIVWNNTPTTSYLSRYEEPEIIQRNLDELGTLPRPYPGIFTITFTQALASVLGFTILSFSDASTPQAYLASSAVNVLTSPKNLIVEIQSLPLESFDSVEKKRRNIVAIVPQLTERNNSLIYEANVPIFLDLNNNFDINLRSIRVKVLTRSSEGDVLIAVSDSIELTLLID